MGYPEDNLTKRGAEANPNGSPGGGRTFSDLYTKNLVKKPKAFEEIDENELSMKEILVRNRIRRAKESDQSQNAIEDRLEGRAKQSTDITSGGDSLKGLVNIE